VPANGSNLLKVFCKPSFGAAAAAPFCHRLRLASGTRRFVPVRKGWPKSERPRRCFARDVHQQVKLHLKPCSAPATPISHLNNSSMSLRMVWQTQSLRVVYGTTAIQPFRLSRTESSVVTTGQSQPFQGYGEVLRV
jgi:hypothetical protein